MNPDEEIIINETIDGVPAGTASSRPRARRKSTVVAAKGLRTYKTDPFIWGIYLSLLVFSVVELFSASSTEVVASNVYAPLVRHSIFLGAGLLLVLWLQKVHYKYFSHYAWPLAILSLGLLWISSKFGVEINGAQRAISIAGFTVQPAEIVKLTVVILLASIMAKNQRPGGVTTRGVVWVAVVVLVFGASLWTNGLTNTLLLMGVSLCMFLIGYVPLKKLGVVLVCYGLAAGVLGMVKYMDHDDSAREFQEMQTSGAVSASRSGEGRADTHKGRFSRYIEGVHPEDPIDDMNRQVIMANFAQANGGLFGQGPGNSRESARLPLAFSDYIYSIIVEDTGFIGGTVLVVLYLWLLARAGMIAYFCRRAFPAFLILGCAVLIVLQALAHMAIVTGVAPVSGQPLPLISKGGTSILVMSAAIGIMLSVSRHAVTHKDNKNEKAELEQLPDELQSANVSAQ